MRALIVGRTKYATSACVGAITLKEGRSLRLFDTAGNYPAVMDYQIGQVWDLIAVPKQPVRPPHVEDVLVQRAGLCGQDPNPRATILNLVEPWAGPLDDVFESCLKMANGKLYVGPDGGMPSCSTGFWIADRALVLHERRYYTENAPFRSISYVGLDPGVPRIEPGELVRLSLARWYQGDSLPEERCYLQVSGTFGRRRD